MLGVLCVLCVCVCARVFFCVCYVWGVCCVCCAVCVCEWGFENGLCGGCACFVLVSLEYNIEI